MIRVLIKRLIVPGVLIFFIFLHSGCDINEETEEKNDALNVVSTTGMINDIVVNVAGDIVESKFLMGPGIDPHLYKASARDVTTLSEADLIFYNGLHLEGKMSEVFEKMKKQGILTVPVAEAVDESLLLSPKEFQGNFDPHIWFDVTMWMKAVERVRDTFVKVDPENQELYNSNSKKYLSDLSQLHNYILKKAQLVPKQKRVLVTAHDAFNYFGRGYGFEVIGLQGISTDTEASTSDVQRISSIILERKIPAIFIESSVSPKYIEAVREAVKSKGFDVKLGGLLYSDAMGNPGTEEGRYIGMFRYNIDTITGALGGS